MRLAELRLDCAPLLSAMTATSRIVGLFDYFVPFRSLCHCCLSLLD